MQAGAFLRSATQAHQGAPSVVTISTGHPHADPTTGRELFNQTPKEASPFMGERETRETRETQEVEEAEDRGEGGVQANNMEAEFDPRAIRYKQRAVRQRDAFEKYLKYIQLATQYSAAGLGFSLDQKYIIIVCQV